MVRHAFRVLTDDKVKTRLIAFSDDMDGLRKVPDNVPNQEMLAQHLGKPLTQVPDPFSNDIPRFGAAQQCAAARLPRPVRLRVRVPVLDRLLHVGPLRRGAAQGARTLRRRDGDHAAVAARGARADLFAVPADLARAPASCCRCRSSPTTPRPAPSPTRTPTRRSASTTPVTGGRCKLQWKPDWAMRWVALGIDYEMAGKDLIDSVKLSGEICRALGGTPPEGFNYELFLDEKGQKISKSKGNGLTIDEWLRYASAGIAVAVHVSRAEGGEAALLRRDPAPRRRVSAVPRRLSAPGRQAAARQPGVAHPFGRAAAARHADHVHDAADAGVVLECRERRDAVGLHRPLPAGRDAADASRSSTRWSATRSTISATSCCRRRTSASRASAERAALLDLRDALSQLAGRRERRSRSRTWSTRSAGASRSSTTRRKPRTASPASRSTGSTCSTRCCSARRKARASARSWRSTGSQNTVDMIDGALARSA